MSTLLPISGRAMRPPVALPLIPMGPSITGTVGMSPSLPPDSMAISASVTQAGVPVSEVPYPHDLRVHNPASNWFGPKVRSLLTHIDPRRWFRPIPVLPPTAPAVTNNWAEFLQDRQVFAEIYRMIDNARHSIQLETFIIHNDETSRTIAFKLAQKAAQGVDVKFLFDPNGSGGSAEVINYLKQYGVQVLPSVKKTLIPGDVDHRKVLIVDGLFAMTGGMNIGDEYAKRWHDTMVKVHGPVVGEMQHKFFEVWHDAGGQGDEAPFLAPWSAFLAGGIPTQLFSTGPGDTSYKQAVFDAIDSAQRYVLIEVPYWGDPVFINHVIATRRRGVDIKVIVPNTSDTFGKLDYPTRPFLQTLIENGIEVYHYQVDDKRNNYAHGKVIVVDGHWVTIGSGNLDFRSFYDNYELNLAFDDPSFARTVEQQLFWPDMQNSVRLTEAPPTNVFIKAMDWLFMKFYHMI